MGIKE